MPALPLVVHDIVKRFGDCTALDGVSLEVRPGEAFGLLGANGSGKTTLNRIIVGLLQPDAGEVQLGGVAMRSDPVGARRKLAYLPESASLYPDLSAVELLDFVAGLRQVADVPAKTERLLAHLGLGEDGHRALGSYSTGMRRKAALASCLISDAPLMLLDEPTNGLDPPSITLFRDILQEWTKRGRSLLVSSHILEFIAKTCQRFAILHRGKLLAVGDLEELRAEVGIPDADLERVYLEVTGSTPASASALLDTLLGEGPEAPVGE